MARLPIVDIKPLVTFLARVGKKVACSPKVVSENIPAIVHWPLPIHIWASLTECKIPLNTYLIVNIEIFFNAAHQFRQRSILQSERLISGQNGFVSVEVSLY